MLDFREVKMKEKHGNDKQTESENACPVLEFLNVPVDRFTKRQSRERKTGGKEKQVNTDKHIERKHKTFPITHTLTSGVENCW